MSCLLETYLFGQFVTPLLWIFLGPGVHGMQWNTINGDRFILVAQGRVNSGGERHWKETAQYNNGVSLVRPLQALFESVSEADSRSGADFFRSSMNRRCK
jgi:hypothetical protein